MKKIFRFLLAVLGAMIGSLIVFSFKHFIDFTFQTEYIELMVYVAVSLFVALIFFMLSDKIINTFLKLIERVEKRLEKVPALEILTSTVGMITGLILAFLISRPLSELSVPFLGNSIFVLLSIFLYIALGILGMKLAQLKRDDFLGIFQRAERTKKKNFSEDRAYAKVLDTSTIIDGRIVEIIKTGFVEGVLIIPKFVLEELQTIADSADDLKRQRGRRGLDLVNEIKENKMVKIEITDRDYPDIKEVDAKLLKLALETNSYVITNDYNLNKLAKVQDIKVLNVNDLANVLKTVVLAGEKIQVELIKEGKEKNQAIGYLEDGTMIVVGNAKKHIGETVEVTVMSVLQTSAGKMIFAKV